MPDTNTGLEKALRNAATRAVKPDMPSVLALALFRSVTGLVRSFRQYRIAAEPPVALSPELRTLLEAVLASAINRLDAPNLSDEQALRLLRAIESLSKAVVRTMPAPAKAKKPVARSTPALRGEIAAEFAAMTARTLEAAGKVNPALADALLKTRPNTILSQLPVSPAAALRPAVSPSATR
jgi:hypothetical protein